MRKAAVIIRSALKCEMDGIKNKEFIIIGRFNWFLDAYLIASRIESEGIECFLPDEMLAKSLNNHFMGISRIKLQVRREDATRAIRILNDEPFDTLDDILIEPPIKCETAS